MLLHYLDACLFTVPRGLKLRAVQGAQGALSEAIGMGSLQDGNAGWSAVQ
jgi:hypothetical protein